MHGKQAVDLDGPIWESKLPTDVNWDNKSSILTESACYREKVVPPVGRSGADSVCSAIYHLRVISSSFPAEKYPG